MNKTILYNQINGFNETILRSKETLDNRYYYVSGEEAKERSLFLAFLIKNNDHIKNIFEKDIKVLDLTYGSGNLTSNIIIENNIHPKEIILNDKFIEDTNNVLAKNLKLYFDNDCIINLTDFDFFDSSKFNIEPVDLLIFNPTSGGKPPKKDYNRGKKSSLKLTLTRIIKEDSLVIFNGKEEEFNDLFPNLNNVFRYIPTKGGNDFHVGYKKEGKADLRVFKFTDGEINNYEDKELNIYSDADLDKLEDVISGQIQLLKPPRDEEAIVSISEKPEITDRREKELLSFFNGLPKDRKDGFLKMLGADNFIDILGKENIIEILSNQELKKEDIDILLKRKESLNIFNEKLKENSDWDEPNWQNFFNSNPWIFGYGLNYQYLKILQKESHISGVDLDGKNEVIGDFLMGANKFTVLVELKRPDTPLFETKKDRSESWKLSKDLTYSMSQILAQKAEWLVKAKTEQFDEEGNPIRQKTFDPKTILIIGSSAQYSGDSKDDQIKAKTFELYRRNSRNIEILTYDELYQRAYFLVNQRDEI